MEFVEKLISENPKLYFVLYHVVFIGIFLILTLSLNLINGFTGLFSLGHHGFWAIGAYVGGYFIFALRPAGAAADPGGFLFVTRDAGLLAGAIVVGGLAAALAGLVIGIPCLRLRGDYLAIATLAFGEIVRGVIVNINAVGGPTGFRLPYMFGLVRTRKLLFYLVLVWIFVVAVWISIRNLVNSYHGRAMRSLGQDEIAAQLSGVNVSAYKVLSFAIGAGFAGIAGVLFGLYVGFFTPEDFAFMRGVTILLMVVLGGLGNLKGTVVATVILYLIPELLRLDLIGPEAAGRSVLLDRLCFLQDFVKRWYLVFYSVLLIVLMLTRPQGIMKRKNG